MLRLITGPAGGGKTARIIREMADRGRAGEYCTLLVPEQYSHDAERQVCAIGGNRMSLWAETVSFSRLAGRLPGGDRVLDAGGRLLVMNGALEAAAPQLQVFRPGRRRSELLGGLLATYDELRGSHMDLGELFLTAGTMPEHVSGKLRDLAVIFDLYESLLPAGTVDPAARLERFAQAVRSGAWQAPGPVFVDGFSDFTAQEEQVLFALLSSGTEVTVCLTCGREEWTEFALPQRTRQQLRDYAEKHGIPVEETELSAPDRELDPALAFAQRQGFRFAGEGFSEKTDAVRVFRAESVTGECRLAAAEALRLVRETGCRWRDIVVTARDWDRYADACESVFRSFGVPISEQGKRGVLQRPAAALVIAALETVTGGWEQTDVFSLLKTGLAGLTPEETDELENYVFTWDIRGESAWCSRDWQYSPDGYDARPDPEKLSRISALRRRAALPLGRLSAGLKQAETVSGMVRALYDYLTRIRLGDTLAENAREQERRGDLRGSQETDQLWEVLVTALEQMDTVCGETATEPEDFALLLPLVLSCYEVGVIPASVDRVSAGGMAHIRRRGVSHLILLGASEQNLPQLGEGQGFLTDSDRDRLRDRGFLLAGDRQGRLAREMNLIYSTLSLCDRSLTVVYPASDGRPSTVTESLCRLFDRNIQTPAPALGACAPEPCLDLALGAGQLPPNPAAAAAKAVLSEMPDAAPELIRLTGEANRTRGRLTPSVAARLYGSRMSLSASRVDKFHSCRYSYFLQYGLQAKPRRPERFDARNTGTLTHYVLENVAREADGRGGFGALSEQDCRELTRKYVSQFVREQMPGFDAQSGRFRYLFRRLAEDMERIVIYMAEELAASDFRPLDFELDFSPEGDVEPEILTDGAVSVSVRGKVDRVDGWVHEGQLYLRVVDYKTGVKKFSLSDVCQGLGLQMLIYLFVLEKRGRERYGYPVVPAGVLYEPARDAILRAEKPLTGEEILRQRDRQLLRGGLLLGDEAVLAAMQHPGSRSYLPVRFRDGVPTGESLASLEQLGALSRKVNELLLGMCRDLARGDISADPFYRSSRENACALCDYFEICHFDEALGDQLRPLRRMKTAEIWAMLEGGAAHGG